MHMIAVHAQYMRVILTKITSPRTKVYEIGVI